MNLRKVDLNLLVYFDALMQMKHVSRAAAHAGITQSAMSGALSRLRVLFDDPLLVRRGHDMIPTERAMVLETEVRNVLRDIGNVIDPPEAFDPETSTRDFRIRMSDLLTFIVLRDLAQKLESDAAGVKLKIDHLSPIRTVDDLAHDRIDVAISTGLDIPKAVRVTDVYQDRVVCLARNDLDMVDGLSGPEAFAAMPQVSVSQSPLDLRFADRNLRSIGLNRNVVITIPHWLSVPDILCSTSLIAVVPESFAELVSQRYPLRVHQFDFFDTAFNWSLYWHHKYDKDSAHAWFRDQLVASCGRSFGASL